MKTTLSQMFNVSMSSSIDGVYQFQIPAILIKTLFIIGGLITIAYLNALMALVLSLVYLAVRVGIFIKDLASIDLNFTLDNDDLIQINEQMWS